MNLIKPKNLKLGDTIAIAAFSGNVEDKGNIFRAKCFFENRGYKVVISEEIFAKYRYLAGDDETRLDELHKFFANPDISAILCARGGYGALRLIEKIDYDLIRKNPKIFCGYSDVTAFSLMMYKKSGLITYSAPMACGDFGIEVPSEFTVNSFWNVLLGVCNEIISDGVVYFDGNAEGVLWGGNLSTVVSLCGLDFIPDEKFIFFVEDVNEPVYKIDRMFTQLLNIPAFRNNIAALVLGEFSGCDADAMLENFIYEIASKLQIPVVSGFKITHERDKITLPIGQKALLNSNRLMLI